MIRVGIVADDLTGAGDTAAQFVRAGWDTELQLRAASSSAQVVAVTTDSRACSAWEAAGAVSLAVEQLRNSGITRLYKKIDSTLRGHIRAEVQAAVDGWPPGAIAVVCPAFPAMSRTVVDGQLRVSGVPVSQTALGADPLTPVAESHVPTLLGASHVAQRAGEPASHLAERISAGGPVVAVDAAGEEELQRVASAIVLLGSSAIPVGSAGLARCLATLWDVHRPPSPAHDVEEEGPELFPATHAIVIVTSLQDVARRQAAAVAAAGAHRYEPALKDLVDDAAWEKWSAEVLDGFQKMGTTLLLTAPEQRNPSLLASLIPRRLADLSARIITCGTSGAGVRISGVVATGGDGARALADALGATGIRLEGEVTTGVPRGRLTGGPADGLSVVTKAGGFGDADTLLRAVQAVRHRRYA